MKYENNFNKGYAEPWSTHSTNMSTEEKPLPQDKVKITEIEYDDLYNPNEWEIMIDPDH